MVFKLSPESMKMQSILWIKKK